MRINLGLILFTILIACSAALSQQNDLSSLLSDLKSANLQKRSAAYSRIKSDVEALKRPEVKAALFDLLDRENQVLRKPAAESNSYSESYGEYVSYLADTAAGVADWRDQRQLCILAHSPYDPISQFSSDLVVKGGAVVLPCFLQMAQGDFGARYQSIPSLIHIGALANALSPAVQQQIRNAASSGLRDSDVLVRQETVEALSRWGKKDMIPTLQKVATSDPVSRRLANGQLYFTVREAATKAIQSIQERAKAKTQ